MNTKLFSALFTLMLALTACMPGAAGNGNSSPTAAPASNQSTESGNGDCVDLTVHPGPTTGQAKEALGVDVQRLDCEIAAFVWRGAPLSTKIRCAFGYVCTLHLTNDKIMVVQGDNKMYSIYAGTFRYVDVYPAEDAVHRPCELVEKEQEFGRIEDPSFTVWTNLSCN